MKPMNTFFTIVAALSLISCSKENPVESSITDATQVANLKNVTLSIDSSASQPATVTLNLPQLVPGKTFAEMKQLDSATYCNPENYGMTFSVNMLADNTKENADDAKFDGLAILLGMKTPDAEPIRTEAAAFTIAKGATVKVTPTGTMNLKTHRVAGLYILNQFAYSDSLLTTESGEFAYKIGMSEGVIPVILPDATIPVSCDSTTKAFLKDAIGSGIFNAQ